jgi:hypothetical protein
MSKPVWKDASVIQRSAGRVMMAPGIAIPKKKIAGKNAAFECNICRRPAIPVAYRLPSCCIPALASKDDQTDWIVSAFLEDLSILNRFTIANRRADPPGCLGLS